MHVYDGDACLPALDRNARRIVLRIKDDPHGTVRLCLGKDDASAQRCLQDVRMSCDDAIPAAARSYEPCDEPSWTLSLGVRKASRRAGQSKHPNTWIEMHLDRPMSMHTLAKDPIRNEFRASRSCLQDDGFAINGFESPKPTPSYESLASRHRRPPSAQKSYAQNSCLAARTSFICNSEGQNQAKLACTNFETWWKHPNCSIPLSFSDNE